MALKFEYLIDRPQDVPQVIRWWHSEWADRMGPDLEQLTETFRTTLSKDKLPLDIAATLDGQLVGTAALKQYEMVKVYPELMCWLGSVYVVPGFRGKGFATSLSRHIIELARQRRMPRLYLQTTELSGGLYARLGWQPLDRLVYKNTETLLMVKPLS